MGRNLSVLVVWIAVGALFLFVHLLLTLRTLTRGKEALGGARWLALVPVLTPWAAWKARDPTLVVVWAVLGVAYAAARIVGAGVLSSAP
ncbi:MAG: hypothetical protein KC417_03090 [Myxococcales bacterium]|nr:hypothetical protein [Myxococcales bacterium]